MDIGNINRSLNAVVTAPNVTAFILMSIDFVIGAAQDLSSYVPAFGWEMSPPSEKQINALEKFGIFPNEIENAGKAAKLLDRLQKRREEGYSTPKQIRLLENKGFQRVGEWSFDAASSMIARIAANGWRVPCGVDPAEYKPPRKE